MKGKKRAKKLKKYNLSEKNSGSFFILFIFLIQAKFCPGQTQTGLILFIIKHTQPGRPFQKFDVPYGPQ